MVETPACALLPRMIPHLILFLLLRKIRSEERQITIVDLVGSDGEGSLPVL